MSTHLEEAVPTFPPRRLDSANHFSVCLTGTGLHLHVNGILTKGPLVLTREEAINLAAWIQVLADPDGAETGRVIREIKGKEHSAAKPK